MIIKRVWHELTYDPYRFVRTAKYIQFGKSFLSKAFKVTIDKSRIGTALKIGDDCLLNCHCIFEGNRGEIVIGNGVFINSATKLIARSGIEIGDWVTIAWGCTIYDHDSHSISYKERILDQQRQLADWNSGGFIASKDWDVVSTAPIVINKYAWLGFDVVVLKGVTIGEGAIIGARSVVTSDIPPWTIAAGSPARVIKTIPLELRANSESK